MNNLAALPFAGVTGTTPAMHSFCFEEAPTYMNATTQISGTGKLPIWRYDVVYWTPLMQHGRFLRPLARLGRKIVFHIPCFGVRMWAEIHLRTTPVFLLRGEYLPRRMDKDYRPIHRRDQQIFRKWRLECSRSRFTAPRSLSHVRILVYTPGRVAGCVSS